MSLFTTIMMYKRKGALPLPSFLPYAFIHWLIIFVFINYIVNYFIPMSIFVWLIVRIILLNYSVNHYLLFFSIFEKILILINIVLFII